MSESKVFTFPNSKKYECKPLVLSQYQRAVGLLGKLKLGELVKASFAIQQFFSGGTDAGNMEIDVESMLAAVEEERLLEKLVATVVVEVNSGYDRAKLEEIEAAAGNLELEAVVEVLQDFFARNESSLRKALGAIGIKSANGAATPAQKKNISGRRRTAQS